MATWRNAMSIGGQLFLATAKGLALASRSRSTTRMWLFIEAWCSGVAFEAFRISTSADFWINKLTIMACPRLAAQCSGD